MSLRHTFAVGLLLTLAGCGTAPVGNALPGTNANSAGDSLVASALSLGPAGLEQLMLERINRARLRPTAEAARFAIALDEGIPGQLTGEPRPPVAFNGTLAVAARRHADDMLANNFFAHNNLSGNTPFDRIRDAGYDYAAAGENLAWRGNTLAIQPADTTERMHEDLFVDSGIADRGHRKVMLNAGFREVGLSVRRGDFAQNGVNYDSLMAVQDYGSTRTRTFFVLGVVYDDRNGNGQYDFGEGTANSAVSLGNQSLVTGEGGGYTFEVQSGDHTVRFSTGVSQDVTVLDKNVKIDLVNGSRVSINLGVGEF